MEFSVTYCIIFFCFENKVGADQKINGGVHLQIKSEKLKRCQCKLRNFSDFFFILFQIFGQMHSSIHFLIGPDFFFTIKIHLILLGANGIGDLTITKVDFGQASIGQGPQWSSRLDRYYTYNILKRTFLQVHISYGYLYSLTISSDLAGGTSIKIHKQDIHEIAKNRAQSFTSLMEDFCQDTNKRFFSFGRCLNGTFP